MARRNIAHTEAGTADVASDVCRVPIADYTDPARWQAEVDRIFKRVPLMLAFAGELPAAGTYKAMEVVGVPVLIVRGEGAVLSAFVNMCSHRGAIVVPDGLGKGRRFSCPYHGWTYDQAGQLEWITDGEAFGKLDATAFGLTPLPVAERAGLIFVQLSPDATLDVDTFLSGYDDVLGLFDFGSWHLASRRQLNGPNWKIAYDGYVDFYHLPVLHRNTFGTDISSQALYDAWGPHQRVTRPNPDLLAMKDLPDDEWDIRALTAPGVWTLFPNVSIASYADGPSALVSQLFPGDAPGRSITIQSFFTARELTDEVRDHADERADFLQQVVNEEDYPTGFGIQRAMAIGAKSEVLFGRNEGGNQRFHEWVGRLVETTDAELPSLFRSPDVQSE